MLHYINTSTCSDRDRLVVLELNPTLLIIYSFCKLMMKIIHDTILPLSSAYLMKYVTGLRNLNLYFGSGRSIIS